MRLIADAARLARTSPTPAPTTGQAPQPPMPRSRVIEHIMLVNRSATTEFLESFSDASLRDYLDHLDHAHAFDAQDDDGSGPSDRLRVVTRPTRGWVRKGDTAALNAMPGDW